VNDSNFDVTGVRKAFANAAEVYSLFNTPSWNATSRLKLETPDAPHDFPESQRRQAYEWLAEQLK
jgi:hypothetical protein